MFVVKDSARWDGFIFKKYGGGQKARWLVCLRTPSEIDTDFEILLLTTTTSIKPDQIKDRKYFNLTKEKYPFFTQECYIYFNEPIFSLQNAEIMPHADKIEIMGKIENDDMHLIYLGYWNLQTVSPNHLKLIRNSLINNSICKELPEPKKNR